MDFIFQLVKNSAAWDPKYHENFFVTHHGFLFGLVAALVIAALCALVYYYSCCNSKNSIALANLPTWIGALAISGLLGYFTANWVIIGKENTTDTTSLFYKYSFYSVNEKYYSDQTQLPEVQQNDQLRMELTNKKELIKTDLNQGNDVRQPFSLTVAVLALLFFYGFSLGIKGFTRAGKTIPHVWPNKL